MAISGVGDMSRDKYMFMAKVADQADRYDDMVRYMDKVVELSPDLTIEERYMLSAAYKNVTGSLRDARRIVVSKRNNDHVSVVKTFKSKVEPELSTICKRILKLLDDNLLPAASRSESKVFYLKMKGDYHRYLAEIKVGDEKKQAATDTMNAYETAWDIALVDLTPSHPMRLGLALNYAVFYYEILNLSDKACIMAKEAFEEAINEVDTIGEETYKESTLIMKLLWDNLTMWTSDMRQPIEDSCDERI